VKVGDLVKLKLKYSTLQSIRTKINLPTTGIVDWIHPHNDHYIRLHNMTVEVLSKYYEVASASR
jgi:hypothetical protein